VVDRYQILVILVVTAIYVTMHVTHLEALPQEFGGPKPSQFRRDFRQLRDLIANISVVRSGKDIVNRKAGLKTAITNVYTVSATFRFVAGIVAPSVEYRNK